MITSIPTYRDKEYVISDNMALIRNAKNLKQFPKYKKGDTIPPGFEVGEHKLIPLQTRVTVTELKIDEKRNVYAFVVPVDTESLIPSGWTRCTNLEGSLANEIISLLPAQWDLLPNGDNYTVTDKHSWIREGSPKFKGIKENKKNISIPFGSYVEVTARSKEKGMEGKYVRVRKMTIEDGQMIAGDPIGWTLADNLAEGNSKTFLTKEWTNQKGDNAAWKLGRYIGTKILACIIGRGGQLQHIALETLAPYFELMEAAKADNVNISVTSGFRTFAKQASLREGWDKRLPGYNMAAKAGRSNHQNGIAFDLNTGGFDGAPVYDWMKKNATAYGFIRTVNKEHWHWEYQPKKAAELRKKGKFKIARVKK